MNSQIPSAIKLLICFVVFFATTGCSSDYLSSNDSSARLYSTEASDEKLAGSELAEFDMEFESATVLSKGNKTPGTQAAKNKRKIIYTADTEIVVEDFSGVAGQLGELVEQNNGYIASENLDRMRGTSRSGYWVVRVPVENYESFLKAISNLGVPASQNQDAQDVTEEFVDIQARIANKKKLEERIIELLDRPDDKIQHVIEVERELARVREDIERMEGRLRFLVDRTSMTTVNISIWEEKNYQPPEVQTLSRRTSNAWQNSLANFRTGFEDFVVFLVANVFVILIVLVAIGIGFVILRMVYKRVRRANAS